MAIDDDVLSHVAKRRTLLERIEKAPAQEAIQLWSLAEKDWAVRITFAARQGLPQRFYSRMYVSGKKDWAVHVALCFNPSVRIDLLHKMSEVKASQSFPTADNDAEEGLAVDDIRRIARAQYRRRIKEK